MATENEGRFGWRETATTDVDAAIEFYASLFDWKVTEMSLGELGSYFMFTLGDVKVGGAMKGTPGVPSHWMAYLDVTDVDHDTRRVEELGGRIIVPPTTVPNLLRFSIVRDKEGASFGIMTDLGEAPPPYEGPPRDGTFVWDELYVAHPDAAMKLYGEVFGWSATEGDHAPPYWHLKRDGKDVGGMMQVMGDMKPHWISYVGVGDARAMTAKAKALGASVLVGSKHIDKVGTLSFLRDPAGASFALFQAARR